MESHNTEVTTTDDTQVDFISSLLRHNISAMFATSVDFIVYSIALIFLHTSYGISSGIGALSGAIVAFFLGRHWSFKNTETKISKQGVRFILVAILSILLNSYGVHYLAYAMNEPHYMIPKVLISIIVGIFVNFPLQRYFVYKR